MEHLISGKGILLVWYICMLCMYIKLYVLKWTDDTRNIELAEYMRYPRFFKGLLLVAFLYGFFLCYISLLLSEFYEYYVWAIVGGINIFVLAQLIFLQRKESPQYKNGMRLFKTMFVYPIIFAIAFLCLAYNGFYD